MRIEYLIIGIGQLGKEFKKKLNSKNSIALDHKKLDITNLNAVLKIVKKYKPKYVINCAAYNKVDEAELDNFLSFKVNSIGAYNLAYACKMHKSFLIHFSTDYVFDGNSIKPYSEKDKTNPINEYGKSKLLGEKLISHLLNEKDYLIFRLSWVYGKGEQNFIYKIKKWTLNNNVLEVSFNEISIPTHTKTIVNIVIKSINKNLSGIYHLTSSGECSRFEFSKIILSELNLKNQILAVNKEKFKLLAKRPDYSVMSNKKISKDLNIKIKNWEIELKEFIHHK